INSLYGWADGYPRRRMPEASDVPLRFIVGAEEARWETTDLTCLPAVRELIGGGPWRVVEVDALSPRELESALEEVLLKVSGEWQDVIALGAKTPRLQF